MKTLPLIPQPTDTNDAGITAEREADGAELGNLCANWKRGCNCDTRGPVNGRLVLCDECEAEAEAEAA